MKLIKAFSVWVALICPFVAKAELFETAAAVPNNLHVYDVSGNTYVDLIPYGCSDFRYYLWPDHPKYDAIISILMAAQIANKKVVFRVDGCNNQRQGNLVGVYLLN